MSKATYLNELSKAYHAEHTARRCKVLSVYKNRNRWFEVCNAYNRRAIRQAKRSVGKSNKNSVRHTAKGLCKYLNERDTIARLCRLNRETTGMPQQVYHISHNGVISHGL